MKTQCQAVTVAGWPAYDCEGKREPHTIEGHRVILCAWHYKQHEIGRYIFPVNRMGPEGVSQAQEEETMERKRTPTLDSGGLILEPGGPVIPEDPTERAETEAMFKAAAEAEAKYDKEEEEEERR